MIERGTIAPTEMICRRIEVDPHAANVWQRQRSADG
jgi:hypothetical protein